jgi:bacillopeptidase F (M6 metalloprotease family)
MKSFIKILQRGFILSIFIISANSFVQAQEKVQKESSDPERGEFNDNGCDEEEVARIDEIKFAIAHSLINAKTINATTDDGTELTAFYVDSELVKLTADAKGFMQEIYVSDGYPVCFEVTSFASDSTMLEHYYFKNNRLVCREEPDTGLKSGPPEEPETDLIVGFEYYLTAIQ